MDGMEYDDTFTSRLLGLRFQVKRDKGRAIDDEKALKVALQNHPPPCNNHRGEPQWNGSEAQLLLKEAMDLGKHLAMRPSDLRMTKPQFQAFSKDTFRWKVRQELRTKKYLHTLKHQAEEKLRAHMADKI